MIVKLKLSTDVEAKYMKMISQDNKEEKFNANEGSAHENHVIEAFNKTNNNNDDSDEEKELTNLNWLLRNQTIAWPNTMNSMLEDELAASTNHSGSTVVASLIGNRESLNAAPNHAKTTTNQLIKTKHQSASVSASQNSQAKRPTPAERYEIFVNKVKRDLKEYEKFAFNYETDVSEKPPFNYSHIIGMAMLENGRVTLQQICNWIESKFAFFRVRKKWNNSIRHNLSLHHCFRKIDRKREEKGKGGYWELGVDPKKCDRKRIRNRKSTQTKVKRSQLSVKKQIISRNKELNNVSGDHDGQLFTLSSLQRDKCESLTKLSIEECLNESYAQFKQNAEIDNKSQIDNSTSIGLINLENKQENHLCLNEMAVTNLLNYSVMADEADPISKTNTLYAEILPLTAQTYSQQQQQQEQQQQQQQQQLEQQHYELGTIIISTTNGILDESMASNLNCLLSDNNYGSQNVVYKEDEIPAASENIIISSYLASDELQNFTNDVCPNNIQQIFTNQESGPHVIIEHLEENQNLHNDQSHLTNQTLYAMDSTACSNLSINSDYTETNFRPYIDGIDEAFQYLTNVEINRNDDILDSLLDVGVSDY